MKTSIVNGSLAQHQIQETCKPKPQPTLLTAARQLLPGEYAELGLATRVIVNLGITFFNEIIQEHSQRALAPFNCAKYCISLEYFCLMAHSNQNETS